MQGVNGRTTCNRYIEIACNQQKQFVIVKSGLKLVEVAYNGYKQHVTDRTGYN
jgi:hypothetical protein